MGTISEMDEKGYLNLKLLKADGRKRNYFIHQLTRGKNSLFRITDKYNLCQNTQAYIKQKQLVFNIK
jgi:DNA polymerase-3 subunit epsilon